MYAIPTAYAIDFFFGDTLRAPFTCPQGKNHNFTASQLNQNPEINKVFNISETIECVPYFGPLMSETISLFAIILAIVLLMYFLKTLVTNRTLFNVFRVCFNLTGFVFAMVFLPWLIEEYIVVTPMWANALIIVLSIFVWLGFPPLRDKASLALIVYLYAYAVKWRVYKTAILGFDYTNNRFWVMLWISGVGRIKAGVGRIKAGVGRIKAGVGRIKVGVGRIKAGVGRIKVGVGRIKAGVGRIKAGGGRIKAGVGRIKAGVGRIKAGVGRIKAGVGRIKAGVGRIKAGVGRIKVGVGRIKAGVGRIKAGVGRIKAGVGRIKAGVGRIKVGVGRIKVGVGRIKAGVGRIKVGVGRIKAGGGRIKVAVGRIKTGGGRIKAGVGRIKVGVGRIKAGGGRIKVAVGRIKAGGGRIKVGVGRIKVGVGRIKAGGGRIKAGGGRIKAGGGRIKAGVGRIKAAGCVRTTNVSSILWMLQKTFFSPESSQSMRISCADFVPWATRCCQPKQENLNRPLTLADIVDLKPEYKCNVAVNNWRKSDAEGEKNCEVLVLSPTLIERIDRLPDEKQFDYEGFITPRDIKLHSAMATSAAVVSYDLGDYGEGVQSVRDLQIVLGLGLGKNLVTQPSLSRDLPCIARAMMTVMTMTVMTMMIVMTMSDDNDSHDNDDSDDNDDNEDSDDSDDNEDSDDSDSDDNE
ncbi:hypothetical protein QZH41_000706 [Actinostola sp. cb2023]|nr:hypothetical protein QZH41_000706 [Actinostola sp. cb2023]